MASTYTTTPLGQLPSVLPASTNPPDVAPDLALLAKQIELKLPLVFATRAARDAAFANAVPAIAPSNGMQCVINNIGGTGALEIDMRIAGSWVKIYPLIYSGTAAPANSLGVAGDLFVLYS